jgi:hypothetical protein
MFADTDAIRALGATNAGHAADLAAVAAALSGLPDASAHAMLGPVGTRFLTALDQATTDASRAAAALADRLAAGGRTVGLAATAYDTADDHAGLRLTRVY